MKEPRMPALLTSSGRPGFYFRVLQEGEVGAGDEIVRVGEANERMTVAEINALLYSRNHVRDRLQRALRIEALSPGWRSSFEALLQSQTTAAGSGNAGSRRQQLRIRLRQDFNRSRWRRSIRSPRTPFPCRCVIRTVSRCHRLSPASTWSCVFDGPAAARHS